MFAILISLCPQFYVLQLLTYTKTVHSVFRALKMATQTREFSAIHPRATSNSLKLRAKWHPVCDRNELRHFKNKRRSCSRKKNLEGNETRLGSFYR